MPHTIRRLGVAVLVLLALAAPAAAQNGRLPAGRLAPIVTPAGCTKLAKAPAAAWNTMALAYGRDLPVGGCDSSYRPYVRQVFWRQWWCARFRCANAAVPGTSNHGWGLAVDVPLWVRRVVDRIGAKFGWCKCWSDAAQEWWHLKWRAGAWERRPDPGTDPRRPRLARGSGGPGQARWVRRAQRRLRAHGRRVRVGGRLGRRTCAAVRRFKRAHRLPRDCEIAGRTWRQLRAPARPRRRRHRKH